MKRFLFLMVLVSPAVVAETKQRTFEFTYVAELDIPEGAQSVRLWLPYPRSDDYQDVRLISIKSPLPTKLYQEYTYRNSMLFLSAPGDSFAELENLRVEMSIRVTRREHQETEFVELEDPEGWVESSASRWLRPVPVDELILEQGEELTAERDTVVEKARAIFDYATDDTAEKAQDCTEANDVFMNFARAVGIAAKYQVGFAIPSERGEGELDGYHCWSEFYVPGFGFVPVDTVAANRKPEQSEYFFGAHDADRVEFTIGRDIALNPKQSGVPLDYFIYPHAEIDGKPVADVRRQFFYKDLDLVAE